MTKDYNFDKMTRDGQALFIALLGCVADEIWQEQRPPDVTITINGREINPGHFCDRLAYWLEQIGHEYATELYKEARVEMMDSIHERIMALEKWMDREIAKKLGVGYNSWERTFHYRGEV